MQGEERQKVTAQLPFVVQRSIGCPLTPMCGEPLADEPVERWVRLDLKVGPGGGRVPDPAANVGKIILQLVLGRAPSSNRLPRGIKFAAHFSFGYEFGVDGRLCLAGPDTSPCDVEGKLVYRSVPNDVFNRTSPGQASSRRRASRAGSKPRVSLRTRCPAGLDALLLWGVASADHALKSPALLASPIAYGLDSGAGGDAGRCRHASGG
jgi:hypothetical protein